MSALVAAMSSTLLQPFRIKPSPLAGPISTPRLVAFAAAQPPPRRRTVARSPLETRATLVAALTWQASTIAQRAVTDLAGEIGRYAFPRRSDGRNLEEALMSVPDLETVKFKLLKKGEDYDIREVQTYFVAETKMPGSRGFDFFGASEAFNVLAGYLFGKNTKTEAMEMTTPVYTRRADSGGEQMDMTTPVITKKSGDNDKWMMSFVMPSKYGSNLPLPVDSHVKIREVPSKIMAAIAFSGFVTDDEVRNRESKLREALKCDPEYRVKEGAAVEVAQLRYLFGDQKTIQNLFSSLDASPGSDRSILLLLDYGIVETMQFNPPFTPPFTRRNELSLEVERKNL